MDAIFFGVKYGCTMSDASSSRVHYAAPVFLLYLAKSGLASIGMTWVFPPPFFCASSYFLASFFFKMDCKCNPVPSHIHLLHSPFEKRGEKNLLFAPLKKEEKKNLLFVYSTMGDSKGCHVHFKTGFFNKKMYICWETWWWTQFTFELNLVSRKGNTHKKRRWFYISFAHMSRSISPSLTLRHNIHKTQSDRCTSFGERAICQ